MSKRRKSTGPALRAGLSVAFAGKRSLDKARLASLALPSTRWGAVKFAEGTALALAGAAATTGWVVGVGASVGASVASASAGAAVATGSGLVGAGWGVGTAVAGMVLGLGSAASRRFSFTRRRASRVGGSSAEWVSSCWQGGVPMSSAACAGGVCTGNSKAMGSSPLGATVAGVARGRGLWPLSEGFALGPKAIQPRPKAPTSKRKAAQAGRPLFFSCCGSKSNSRAASWLPVVRARRRSTSCRRPACRPWRMRRASKSGAASQASARRAWYWVQARRKAGSSCRRRRGSSKRGPNGLGALVELNQLRGCRGRSLQSPAEKKPGPRASSKRA